MLILVGFWIAPLFTIIRAADGDDCIYNDLHGSCVTLDAQLQNEQCHNQHGWLQLFMGFPPPRVYRGCGDDGVVIIRSWICSSSLACVLPCQAMR